MRLGLYIPSFDELAAATERIRLGPMVTPLARRRPAKVARETATLDRLSDGRLILGVGLGSDEFAGEYSITGEELDDRKRAGMLDEALGVLQAAWTGGARAPSWRALHRSTRCGSCRGRSSVPACRSGSRASTASPGHFAARSGTRASSPWASSSRTSSPRSPPSSAVSAGRQAMAWRSPSTLPSSSTGSDPAPYGAGGATWGLVAFPWNPVSVDQVRGVIREEPPPMPQRSNSRV